MALVRIYDNTLQPTPESGWLVPISKDGETDLALDLSAHLTYEEKISITGWDMSANAKHTLSGIPNFSTIDRIEGLVIFDDDGLEYNGFALYDSYVHTAQRQLGNSATKTVNITGTAASAPSASINTNGAVGTKRRRLIYSGFASQPSMALTTAYRDTALMASAPTLSVDTSRANNWALTITHLMGNSNYECVVTNVNTDASYSNISSSIVGKADTYTNFFFCRADSVIITTGITFFVEFYSTTLEELDHVHSMSISHTHTLTGSGITGQILVNGGFAGRSVQCIPRINRTAEQIEITHNNPASSDTNMTAFGSFTVNSSGQSMQKFKTATLRGYVIVKRIFTPVI